MPALFAGSTLIVSLSINNTFRMQTEQEAGIYVYIYVASESFELMTFAIIIFTSISFFL